VIVTPSLSADMPSLARLTRISHVVESLAEILSHAFRFDGKWFSSGAVSALEMHRNALQAGVLHQTTLRKLPTLPHAQAGFLGKDGN